MRVVAEVSGIAPVGMESKEEGTVRYSVDFGNKKQKGIDGMVSKVPRKQLPTNFYTQLNCHSEVKV